MSDTSDSEQINDVVFDEPMFYILTQFLETKDGKNIATVLDELTNELKSLRVMLSSQNNAVSTTKAVATNTSTKNDTN